MRIAGYRLATLLMAVFCLLNAAPALAANPPLKKGVALHGPMTWGRVTPDQATYQWPVYEGADYRVPVPLLRKVRAAGFDFIRLSVDPGPFLAFTGAKRDALDKRLAEVIGDIRGAGLYVIVDFHPIGMVKAYAPDRIESNADGLFDAYANMVGRTAKLYAAQTAHIAIEPMNEPQLGYDPFQRMRWQGMIQRLYQAVRMEAPGMTVIVSGGRGGSIDGLLDLDPAPFLGDVRYSFHYYEPYVFTMQGVKDDEKESRIWRFMHGLSYPSQPKALETFMEQVKERVEMDHMPPQEKAGLLDSGEKQIAAYGKGKGTRATIDADFNRVAAWAASNDIPPGQIFLGEFGASQMGPSWQGAAPDDRARWLKDVRETAEAHGFHWSMWNLNDQSSNGMTLVPVTNPSRLDTLTLQALGMKPESGEAK